MKTKQNAPVRRINTPEILFRGTLVLMFVLFAAVLSAVPTVRIKLQGNNANDETVIYYQQGASSGFDSNYDAYKLRGSNTAASISQISQSVALAINGIAPVSVSFSIDLEVLNTISGSYTISASDFSELPAGTRVMIKDKQNNLTTDLLPSDFVFVSTGNDVSRFVILILAGEEVADNEGRKGKPSKKIRTEKAGSKRISVQSETELSASLIAEFRDLGGSGSVSRHQVNFMNGRKAEVQVENLRPGIYQMSLSDKTGIIHSEKLLVQE